MPPHHPKYNKPLPAKDFFALKPGDKYVIYWAKDDDVRDLRLNFAVQTVDSIIGSLNDPHGLTIFPDDEGYEWTSHEMIEPGDNTLDTSRGYAYLFRYEP